MPIIFLDIDGVLNCASTTQQFQDVVGIGPKKVVILNRILEKTGAQVVLSSTWRFDQDWRTALARAGLPMDRFIGVTDRMKSRIRGEEIQQWINDHGPIDRYTILDDDADFLPGQPLFQTTWEYGLTDAIADAVIDYLLENRNRYESKSPINKPYLSLEQFILQQAFNN